MAGSSARFVAIRALSHVAKHFGHVGPITLDTGKLDTRDARLALAIYRTTLQRWLTLEFLLERHLKRSLRRLEPDLQGVLLSAAAQIVFMDRLPTHAVVHESVELARRIVRPGAARLVNAVLRRLAELVGPVVHDEPWHAARDRLPLENGYVPLTSPCLPDQTITDRYLSIATSHPLKLVREWMQTFDTARTTSLCLQDLTNPPTIVAVESDFCGSTRMGQDALQRHSTSGFVIWRRPHNELQAFLADHPARRVQDPATALPVDATRALSPRLIVDACAGRGTKTRQLAVTHPNATIVATDSHPDRRQALIEVAAAFENIQIVEPERLTTSLHGRDVDLIVLDVPCTNTGVLARRPEARYRYSATSLKSLVSLQRELLEKSVVMLTPGGTILYTTCSLQPTENHNQARWIAQELGAQLVKEQLTLPEGSDTTYHDGGYYAHLRIG